MSNLIQLLQENQRLKNQLNKLKQIPKFKTPVIIAIDKEKEFIKDHFIKDGFKDCLKHYYEVFHTK